MTRRPNSRLRIPLAAASSLLLVSSLFVPWWTASARLPAGEAGATLTLYSFHFESRGFDCVAVLFFYPYGSCPLLGGEAGIAALSFYLFWSLFFVVLSIMVEVGWLGLLLRSKAQWAAWLPSVSLILTVFGNFSFIGAISAAGLKFVSGSALYGSSEVLTWTVSVGFFLAISSALAQLADVYIARRGV